MRPRRQAVPLFVAAALLLAGCHARREPVRAGEIVARVGTYRGAVEMSDGRTRRFRLLLWAALPDRIHAELLPPVGGPRWIVDGGGGRLAVAVPGDRTTYTGEGSGDAVEALTGVAVPLEQLVRWLLMGADPAPETMQVIRRPEKAEGLPEIFEIRSNGRLFRIERRGMKTARLADGTGTGSAPPGFAARPIEELPASDSLRPDPAEGEER